MEFSVRGQRPSILSDHHKIRVFPVRSSVAKYPPVLLKQEAPSLPRKRNHTTVQKTEVTGTTREGWRLSLESRGCQESTRPTQGPWYSAAIAAQPWGDKRKAFSKLVEKVQVPTAQAWYLNE